MKKWAKRLTLWTTTLVCSLIVCICIAIILMRGTPDWYQAQPMSDDQRAAASRRATNKLAIVQNEALRVRVDERASQGRNGRTPTTTTRPVNAIVISFTDEEINALIEDWTRRADIRAIYEKYFTDPRVIMMDNRLILAGKLKEINAVTSLHFEPRIDENGKLSLKLVRMLAGKLPLPTAILATYQEKVTRNLAQRLPAWRQQAKIDPSGLANSAAISAEMSQIAMSILRNEPADPILFLRPSPIDTASIPVRLSDVSIEDHTLTMIAQPMNSEQRTELLRHIRGETAELPR